MPNKKKIIIRAGEGTLSFLIKEDGIKPTYYPYVVKSGMSLAANLREAFREQPELLDGVSHALLLVPTPIALMPEEEYNNTEQFDVETFFNTVITGHRGEKKIIKEIDDIEAVGVFTVNADLHMVVSDNYAEVDTQNVMIPVWKHLYNRYYQSSQRRKLFAYFHDKKVDICAFEQHRIRFANTFDASHAHDALYYILFVWKQLGMNQAEDSLHVIGSMPHEQWLRGRLATYLSNIYDINPNADLNRSLLAQVEGLPFDMMLCE